MGRTLLDFDEPSLRALGGGIQTAQAVLVVEVDVHPYFQLGLIPIRQSPAAKTFHPERLMSPLNLAVTLRIVAGSGHMSVDVHSDTHLQLLSNKLLSIVRDESWTG